MDDTDRTLIGLLQRDASQPYAELARAVHLSTAAVHERVRKLRRSGVIRRTTVEVDPVALGALLVAFVEIAFVSILARRLKRLVIEEVSA